MFVLTWIFFWFILYFFNVKSNSDGEFSDGLDEFEESREDSPEKKKVSKRYETKGFD